MKEKVAILGGGSWGAALAFALAQNGYSLLLWDRDKKKRGVPSTTDLSEACQGALILVNTLPSDVTRGVWQKISPLVNKETCIVNGSKGFEWGTHKRLSVVLSETLPYIKPSQILVLSGPSFSKEVLDRQPTMMVLAGTDLSIVQKIKAFFHNDFLRIYESNDVIGVETGGAVKNVIAIGCGLCDGMGLGQNTRAALITRGLYEMAKLGKALGASPLTFAGLSGMGDLILTCTGDLSRNRRVGFRLGQGEKLPKILHTLKETAEGVKTAKAVFELAREYHITAPVCTEIYRILYEGKPPQEALQTLMQLELKAELGGLL